MNPQKTIPTMNDNGLFLNESRGMMQYLCNKYAKNDKLYSKVPNERAVIDCRLNFDMGTLYSRFGEAYVRIKLLPTIISGCYT
jgi:glutathione S-transferase